MIATLKLFNGIVLDEEFDPKNKKVDTSTIKKGYVLDPKITNTLEPIYVADIKKTIEKEIFPSGEKLNQSFHKNWKIVQEASIEFLVVQQVAHYITTYGFESMGIYNPKIVYIPLEDLEVPELDKGIELLVVKAYTTKEMEERISNLLSSGVALGKETIDLIMEVISQEDLNIDFDKIKNKEVRVILANDMNTILSNPVEFLRQVIYKVTGSTLLIKDEATIDRIKVEMNFFDKVRDIHTLFNKYDKKHGFKNLAKIFNRFKPLFLSLKSGKDIGSQINKISKLSKKYHEPLPEDFLNSITSKIEKGDRVLIKDLRMELEKVNAFRKVRLLYALQNRIQRDYNSTSYKIRNGKSYSTSFNPKGSVNTYQRLFKQVRDSLVSDIKKNIGGKKIYYPKGIIQYALPATEKGFGGNVPIGTKVTLSSDAVIGIHWYNLKHRYDNGESRIDLDLSFIDVEGEKIGWNTRYRNDGKSILFSGDLTTAPLPHGASELFYIKRRESNQFLLYCNFFNHYDEDAEIPFQIVIGKQKEEKKDHKVMIDPNGIVLRFPNLIDKNNREKVLGLVTTDKDEVSFSFFESTTGRKSISSATEHSKHLRCHILNTVHYPIPLYDLLVDAGAKFVTNPEDADINLSPMKLEKDTFLSMLY